jgi:hypothetical protein
MLWLCSAFWSRDMSMCLVLSAFTSVSIQLLCCCCCWFITSNLSQLLQPSDSDQSQSQLPRNFVFYTKIPSPIYQYVIILDASLPFREVQVYLWMFLCRNIMLLTTGFFYVAKLSILTTLSLITLCRHSFQIVDLKIFSLPTFPLKSPNKFFIWYLGKLFKKHTLIPNRNCRLNHHFSPHLVHAH